MTKITVFCGSRPGKNPYFINLAKELGSLLAKENIHLIYGGASIGLMGAVADSVLENKGKVTGVITTLLNPIEGHTGLTDLRIVENMHDRKNMMYELGDAFIIMPGGFGTMDEFFEIVTWSQLNIHKKPIGILNAHSYYDKLIALFENMLEERFIHEEHQKLYFEEKTPSEILKTIQKKLIEIKE
jgi:hypothetical protein